MDMAAASGLNPRSPSSGIRARCLSHFVIDGLGWSPSSRIVRHACHGSSGAFPADLFSSFSKTIRYSSQRYVQAAQIL